MIQIETSLPEDVLNGSSDKGALVLSASGKRPIEVLLNNSSPKPQRLDPVILTFSYIAFHKISQRKLPQCVSTL